MNINRFKPVVYVILAAMLLTDFAYCTYGTPQWDSIRNAIDKDNNWWKDK